MIDLGKVQVELDKTIELDLDKLMPIGVDLSGEFTHQPSLYVYIAMISARTEATWLESKRELDRMYALTDKEVRKDLADAPSRITEKMVEVEIKLRKGYHDSLMYELDCREQYLVMKAVTRAFDMRAQMLISLGAHLRAEAEQTGMMLKDVKDTLRSKRKSIKQERKHKQSEYEPVPENDDPFYPDDEDEIPF